MLCRNSFRTHHHLGVFVLTVLGFFFSHLDLRLIVDAFSILPHARSIGSSTGTTSRPETLWNRDVLKAHTDPISYINSKEETGRSTTTTITSTFDYSCSDSFTSSQLFWNDLFHSTHNGFLSTLWGMSLLFGSTMTLTNAPLPVFAATTPSTDIVGCLVQKCPVPLAKCVVNPKCLANVVCINTCTGRPDEIECQIKCGDTFENQVVGEFNKCVVSDMSCVPQQPDDGRYPVPTKDQVVPKFNTNFFNGRLYISAGQNPLFDIFDCQVHFFTETEPGRFFGKLNWRVSEPDGEFFTRDALQEFYQDPSDPSHMINHDNEYLHYKDDWWIIDYEYDNNAQNIPPFAFIYYRGSNDAWDGYGGAVVYTRAAKLPEELIPRLRQAAAKVNMDWDTQFTVTDNSCPSALSDEERLVLREQFAGKAILRTQDQVRAQATRLRGNVVNSVKAQKLFFDNRFDVAGKAYERLEKDLDTFEQEGANK